MLQKESNLNERITELEKACSQLEVEKQSQEAFLGKVRSMQSFVKSFHLFQVIIQE